MLSIRFNFMYLVAFFVCVLDPAADRSIQEERD